MMETVVDEIIEIEQQSVSLLLCHFCTKPITNLSRHDPDSLLMHHITYVPEVKVPMHRVCHTEYHNTHPNHPKNPVDKLRRIFIDNIDDNDTLCYFCGKFITENHGRGPESRAFHSLDHNHDNWDINNKVSTHKRCHNSYHSSGENNPMYGKPNYWGYHTDEAKHRIGDSKRGIKRDPDIFLRGVATARARYGDTLLPPKATKERSERMKRNNPAKNHDTVMKGVKTRRERYGPSGCRDPELRNKRIGDANRGNSQIGIKGRQTRRELYGPSGYSEEGLKKIRDRVRVISPETSDKIWQTRRERYGPTGRKPKNQVEDIQNE